MVKYLNYCRVSYFQNHAVLLQRRWPDVVVECSTVGGWVDGCATASTLETQRKAVRWSAAVRGIGDGGRGSHEGGRGGHVEGRGDLTLRCGDVTK
jgi:hypothetical protein